LAVVGDLDLVIGDAGFRLEPLGAGIGRRGGKRQEKCERKEVCCFSLSSGRIREKTRKMNRPNSNTLI
jgi:hypothetical protein